MAKSGELDEYLKGGTALIWPEKYAVVKSKETTPNCFALIQDQNEITIIMKEEKADTISAIEVEKGWKIITFDMTLPFSLVGFLAHIAQALAEAGISIFAVSAFSTDHVLVKATELNKTIDVLESLGLKVEYL